MQSTRFRFPHLRAEDAAKTVWNNNYISLNFNCYRMKRKFINALLFGTLIAASTSTFVSCAKDYDGNTTELRKKITSNATGLISLVDEKG